MTVFFYYLKMQKVTGFFELIENELVFDLGYNDVNSSTETNLYTMVSTIGNNLSGG